MEATISEEMAHTQEQIIKDLGAAPKPEELFDDPHLNASHGFTDITLENGTAARVPILPLEMDGRRFGARLDVPKLGSHTADLLAELGYTDTAVQSLTATNVVAARGGAQS